jgi:hypothetical protein
MCQIIALQSKKSDIIKYLIDNKNKIKNSLDRKGGEGYSISAFIEKAKKYKRKKLPEFIIVKSKNFDEAYNEILYGRPGIPAQRLWPRRRGTYRYRASRLPRLLAS